jgi:tetratricopeptide (TPR) repeat protein
MVKILLVRELKNSELEALERGKSSKNIFIVRRCQILLASAKGKKSSQIAKDLSCSAQTVRNAIKAFNQNGLESIQQITRPKLIPPVSKLIQKANQQKEKGKLDKAISTYRNAIALYPSSAWSYHYLGEILIEQGNFEEAIACYQKAIKFNPSVSEHYNKLGEVYFKQRQLDNAVDFFKKAISLDPHSAWYHQNLGEALAQKHQWGAAVNCYRHALKLNPDEVLRYHDSLKIEPDDPKIIKVHNPVFIVGCGHSGTSIMLAILSNHPAFYPITYESALFKRSESEIREIMLQWDRECIEAGKKRWIEKTPPHIFHIKKFLLHRPQSKFILMLRDGRDVVCSLKYRTEYKSFEERVERWIYDNLAGLPYWNHPNVMVVKYEDLVGETEITLRKVFSFLGENYTSEVLDYYKHQKHWYHSEIEKPMTIETHKDHHKLRNWQINQPLFDRRGRWKTEMEEQEKTIFKKVDKDYLIKFGYAQNDQW